MVHHHPNEPVQNHLEHNLENVSYGVWHEMKPLNLNSVARKFKQKLDLYKEASKSSHWSPLLDKIKAIIQAWGAS
jgi:hypothetical protein